LLFTNAKAQRIATIDIRAAIPLKNIVEAIISVGKMAYAKAYRAFIRTPERAVPPQ